MATLVEAKWCSEAAIETSFTTLRGAFLRTFCDAWTIRSNLVYDGYSECMAWSLCFIFAQMSHRWGHWRKFASAESRNLVTVMSLERWLRNLVTVVSFER